MGYVAIVDYYLGNLFSVQRACVVAGLDARITSNKKEILKADGIILPGVGAFGDAMNILQKQDLLSPLREFIDSGKPFLGICLGMQLLMSQSEEFGLHKGLNVFSGTVVRFPDKNDAGDPLKIPQVGWNKIFSPNHTSVDNKKWNNTLLENIEQEAYMYFVHSFRVIPDEQGIILGSSIYEGISYVSAIMHNNVTAFQFHPEKSGQKGIQIYSNFARLVAEYNNKK
ncbi:MAG: imidazole glycerol phosphate synthase subunit HisH [bacterium]|nr:imidazole glycerol phosphate synthase subunit HisH [bacterium]